MTQERVRAGGNWGICLTIRGERIIIQSAGRIYSLAEAIIITNQRGNKSPFKVFNPMQTAIIISKLDTVRRQLDTAIRLYFSSADPISIHTLAAAAHRVMKDINSKAGGDPMLRDKLVSMFYPKDRKTVRRKLAEAENFFKHADHDHGQTLKFKPGITEFLLFDTGLKYIAMTGEDMPTFQVFSIWFMLHGIGKNIAIPSEVDKARRMLRNTLSNPTRESFFQETLPLVLQTLNLQFGKA
jgi:hypothetical protein